MNHILLSSLFALALLLGCSTPEIAVDPNLQEAGTSYTVQGRNGWLINQRLSFGEFQSGKVNRSWTKGYDIPFVVRFTGAKEKLSFEMRDGGGQTAEVLCLGKLREQDLTLFNRYFDINLQTRDAFTGTVVLNGARSYDFFVANLNQSPHTHTVEGHILGQDVTFTIRSVMRLTNQRQYLGTQSPGFEFLLDDKVVGAVATLNQGKVWIHNDLDDRHRLVVAGVAAALLLRSELADHNDPEI